VEKPEVIKIVRDRLAKVNGGIEFEIIEDGVRPDESWWYVPLIARRNGHDVPREVTVQIYANIETELEDDLDLTVLFIPANAA